MEGSCPGEPCCPCEWRPGAAARLPAAAGGGLSESPRDTRTQAPPGQLEPAGPGMTRACVRGFLVPLSGDLYLFRLTFESILKEQHPPKFCLKKHFRFL